MKKPDIGLNLYTSSLKYSIFILLLQILTKCVAVFNDINSAPICENPNQNVGTCIPIRECKPLLSILQHERKDSYKFLRQSQCFEGHGEPPFVCCTNETKFMKNSYRIIFPDECEKKPETAVYLPRPPNCGLITVGQRIYGGEEAKLTEFSWMVNLQYRKKNGEAIIACAGSLINKRYVLTAAHCVTGKIEIDVGRLELVRVGEHNTDTELDCDEYGCLAPAQYFGIENRIVHDGFQHDRRARDAFHHDIALLRLDHDVEFNDALQPVCLPIDTQFIELHAGTYFTVAGWGHNGSVSNTAEKRKVYLPLVDKAACRRSFVRHLDVFDEQICAGGLFRKDSCTGDSGGPLMHLYKSAWFMEGVVSFGIGCGVERPAIYTNVRRYIDWIKENINT